MLSRKSFTLIEVLVVLGIIGALTALLVPNYMAARQRSRDSIRKSDLKQIQKALELTRQDHGGIYPDLDFSTLVCNQLDSCSGSALPCFGTPNVYMTRLPQDPLTTCTSSPLAYYFHLDSTTTYTLAACLENASDPDRDVASCPGTYSCASGRCYTLHAP